MNQTTIIRSSTTDEIVCTLPFLYETKEESIIQVMTKSKLDNWVIVDVLSDVIDPDTSSVIRIISAYKN